MATLYITEFAFQGKDGAEDVTPIAQQLPLAEQTRSLSASSAQSSALNAQTRLVRLQTDTACFILFGANPTATTSKMPLAVAVPEYFGVPANCGFKIAAITA
jgi:hypothetical protein